MYDKDENGRIEQEEMVDVFKKIVKRKSKIHRLINITLFYQNVALGKKSPKTEKKNVGLHLFWTID